MTKDIVDVLIHIPLEMEFLEFREIFPVKSEIVTDLNVAGFVHAPSNLRVAFIVQEKMGRSSAFAACNKALELFSPRIYVCLGIAGGLSKDIHLGDVCYTGNLIDVSDNAKITDLDGGGVDLSLSSEFYQTDRRVTAALGYIRTLSSLADIHNFWREDQENYAKQICNEPVIGRDDHYETIGAPKCLNGDIVCGLVSASDNYRNKLRGITRNILAVETESGPVFENCGQLGIPAITIRGISDYANASKGKLEGDTKELIRKIAARNAASFLHAQLQSPIFLEALNNVCGSSGEQHQLPLATASTNPIPALIDKLGASVDTKLRELSPQFRTKPLGFRLPTPRLKREISPAAENSKSRPRAREFIHSLSRTQRMLLYVPRTYPDQALPWVLASSLLTADLGGKKVVPVVIDGRKIGPPRDSIQHVAPLSLDPEIAPYGGEYVFIIDEPPLLSKTKIAFLAEDMKKWEQARFVFLTRTDKAVVESTEFVRHLSVDEFDLCDVSFLEMAAFLESSFAMPSQEAEVVAYRLKGMFNRFSLPAHPSFFAGIPSEALSSLLLANRRSELIQLAVDGFLSFVVANDIDPIRMSRTNRSRFLRRFVVELVHEKKNFTESELVDYAKKISDDYDYGINALAFINSFVEAGLIYFDNGKASITLPFIQSYLLADELNKDSRLAIDYYQSSGDDIDLAAIELYAEIGPSDEFIRLVMDNLVQAIDAIEKRNEPHILLQGTIQPAILKNPGRLNSLSRHVSEARSAVANGDNGRKEKAAILDIADRVNEDIADRADTDNDDEPESDATKPITALLKAWIFGLSLLGCGAESLTGSDRQALAQRILHGGELLLEEMLRHFLSIDYQDIKQQIIADEEFRGRLHLKDDEEYESVVKSLVDFLEFMTFSQPLDRVFDQLPDRARHKIIGNSLTRVVGVGQIQELIRVIWLTNINPQEGRNPLLKAIAALPKSHFLRASLTSIFMMRAKWNLSDYDARIALLDAAELAVKPFHTQLDKGEMMRFVAKHQPGEVSDDDDDD